MTTPTRTTDAYPTPRILLLEPFCGGSHKQLLDLLYQEIPGCVQYTLPAKKWHWRARTAALYMSQTVPVSDSYRVLFCSSVLNLAELVALRSDLARLRKIIYFHENQLVYPVRKQQERDFQYGYNQILSCLVADECIFNSQFNMDSFLAGIQGHMKLIPDHRPKNLSERIRPKCRVLHFPIRFPQIEAQAPGTHQQSIATMSDCGESLDVEPANRFLKNELVEQKVTVSPQTSALHSQELGVNPLHIVWPHRWEHDKDPGLFFETLYKLKEYTSNFRISVLGETYTDVPEVFEEARQKLSAHIHAWGYQESKASYYSILQQANMVISTAKHEFFGVAMLEATHFGCYPLCPKALVYPEIFPAECLYNTPNQLLQKLKQACKRPDLVHKRIPQIDTQKFSWEALSLTYKLLLTDYSPCSQASPSLKSPTETEVKQEAKGVATELATTK